MSNNEVDYKYYLGYSREDIHEEMLNDEERMKTYGKAIE